VKTITNAMDAAGSSQEKQPLLVIAKFKFEGRNNDEVRLLKNFTKSNIFAFSSPLPKTM
jgi:hypothetical protein